MKMFAIRPNPDYVPGGVNNFWLSGHGGRPTDSGAGGGGGGGVVESKNTMANAAGSTELKERKFVPFQEVGKGDFGKESFLAKFGNMMENFAPLVNTYNI